MKKITATLLYFMAVAFFAVCFTFILGAEAAFDSSVNKERPPSVVPFTASELATTTPSPIALFTAPSITAPDWRQYAVFANAKPELLAPSHVVVDHSRTPQTEAVKITVLTLQVHNIQVQAKWSVHNALSAFDIDPDGKLYLTLARDEMNGVTELLATVYVVDEFKNLNPQYENLTVHAIITVALHGDLTMAVSVMNEATLRVIGGAAILSVDGDTQNLNAGVMTLFNLTSPSGVLVSAATDATIAIATDLWHLTLYSGSHATFAGLVVDSQTIVAMSLFDDTDFSRVAAENISLVYVFDDNEAVALSLVSPQSRIFSRNYDGARYWVIARGTANIAAIPREVNLLALDDGQWQHNNTLLTEAMPFTIDDFMATVPYGYSGKVGELQANNGVAPSFSLVGKSDIFAVSLGVLSLTMAQAPTERLTLWVTVQAEDHLGDLLGGDDYHNRLATVIATVEVAATLLLTPGPLVDEVLAGIDQNIYKFVAQGGTPPYTYILTQNPDANSFAFSHGTLSVNANATSGRYRFTVAVTDAQNAVATAAVTVTVVNAATIRVIGNAAVLSENGDTQNLSDGVTALFNPKSPAGVLVSAATDTTVAIATDLWQLTLYGGSHATFAGLVVDSQMIVAMSLFDDTDFSRVAAENISLVYGLNDGEAVALSLVSPQSRIFSRNYDAARYWVIDRGTVNIAVIPPEVNFLALDDGQWQHNNTLLAEAMPFTIDDFMATVSYGYIGDLGELRTHNGVAPSFSLVGKSDIFAVSPWLGVLSLTMAQAPTERLTLLVTVQAEDHLGDLLGGDDYHNRLATVTVTVEVAATLALSTMLFVDEVLAGIDQNIYKFVAQGGTPPYTYILTQNPDANSFAFSHGTLSVNANATSGLYRFTVAVTDAQNAMATAMVTVTVANVATIRVIGGAAVFSADGDTQNLTAGVITLFNPTSPSEVLVSAATDATVAIATEIWQLTLYGGSHATFAGVVVDSQMIVAMSLFDDTDFSRVAAENISLVYGLSDGEAVALSLVSPQSQIFNRTYGGAQYWVLTQGTVNILVMSPEVNFLALADGRWEYDNSLLTEFMPFTIDNFIVTVANGYTGALGELQANNGVAPSFSLVGESDIFALSPPTEPWSPGVLSIVVAQQVQEIITLWVTVQAEDHLGDLLGGDYRNRLATITARVQAGTKLSFSSVSPLEALAGNAGTVYVFAAQGGTIPYTYTLTQNPDINSFTLSHDTLLVNSNATIGQYLFTVAVTDAASTAVTVVATVSVVPAATIRIIGGMAKLVTDGTTQAFAAGSTVWFNPKVQSERVVSAMTGATVAIATDAWHLTLYGGSHATFAGVMADGDIIVAMSLTEDSDFIRVAEEKISLVYGFSEDVTVSLVSPQNRIFNRTYGGIQYWVIDHGTVNVLATPPEVNFLALAEGQWQHNNTLLAEAMPFTAEGFMVTVSHGYLGDLGELQAHHGVAPSFSLLGESDLFAISPWFGQWSPGVLSLTAGPVGPANLSVTVRVEDHLGDLLRDYQNRQATVTVTVMVTAADALSFATTAPRFVKLVGISVSLHTFRATGGIGDKQYTMVASNANHGFTLAANGVLSLLESAAENIYTLQVVAYDQAPSPNRITMAVTVHVSDKQIYVLGGLTPAFANDIWLSTDGKAWAKNTNADWLARRDLQALVHHGSIYVVGGFDGRGESNDVWASADGEHWILMASLSTSEGWKGQIGIQAVAHNGSIYVMGGSYGNARHNDVWASADGIDWVQKKVDDNNVGWNQRLDHQAVSHNGLLYVLGGYDRNNNRRNDVWYSVDGAKWDFVANADWPARSGHQALVHQGRIYVLGGNTGSLVNDVWSSADGETWVTVKANNNVGWPPREEHQALSYNGKIYVMGGTDGTDRYNDVWSSVDGKEWEEETPTADWLARFEFAAVAFPPEPVLAGLNQITITANVATDLHTFTAYGVGGYTYSLASTVSGFSLDDDGVLSADGTIAEGEYLLTIWVTDDKGDKGQTAVKVRAIKFSLLAVPLLVGIEYFIPVLHTLIAQGGVANYQFLPGDDNHYFDLTSDGVLSSQDTATVGVYTLVVEASNSISSATATITIEIREKEIYVLGGTADGSPANDLWSSPAGEFWVARTNPNWTARRDLQALVHNDRLYMLGGFDGRDGVNDVWSSANGEHWILAAANVGWEGQIGIQAVAHNGSIYVLGGSYGGSQYNDVWASADGIHWGQKKANNNMGWLRRTDHQAVSHNGLLYVLGGWRNGYLRDVWSSVDGAEWDFVVNPPWPERSGHQALVHQDRIYVLGGRRTSDYFNDVWSSADGKNWRLEKADDNNVGWSRREEHQALSYNDKIYVMGGNNGTTPYNDVWSSTDGKTWEVVTITAGWSTRIEFAAVVFPHELVLAGVSELTMTATVPADLHSFTASYGVAEYTYSLFPPVASFRVPEGILSTDGNIAPGEYTLTVWVEDHKGERAQTAVKVYVNIPFELVAVPPLSGDVGAGKILHTITVTKTDSNLQYQIVAGDPDDYFYLGANNGVLSLRASAVEGVYILLVEATNPSFPSLVQATISITIDVASERIYVLGGSDGTRTNDVWSSPSGKIWAASINADWSARRDLQALVHHGSIYVVGGFDGRGDSNDVWAWADGEHWSLMASLSRSGGESWLGQIGIQAVAHNGSIYVLGGSYGANLYNDVWASADGIHWVQKKVNNNNVGWITRTDHQAVSHNGLLYVLGGWHQSTYRRDVWSSADGAGWDFVVTPPWPGRSGHQALVHQGRIYVLGGRAGGHFNDVWSSVDGKHWRLEKANNNVGWPRREEHQALSYNGKIYVMGGIQGATRYNDVWSSVDGKTWQEETAVAGWSKRDQFQAVVFPPDLVVVGTHLTITAGVAAEVHTFTALYGMGDYTYSLSPTVSGFSLTPGGVLSADGNITEGEHILTIQVEDSQGERAQTAVRVLAYLFLENLSLPDSLLAFPGNAVPTFSIGVGYAIGGGNQQGYFSINPNSGVLSVHDHAVAGNYTLTMTITGGLGDTALAAVTVEVLPPLPPNLFASENVAADLYTLAIDGVSDKAYRIISGDPASRFSFGNGVLSVSDTAETKSFALHVEASVSTTPVKATARVRVFVGSMMLLMGGVEFPGIIIRKVWSSYNGYDWLELAPGSWAHRRDHQVVAYRSKIYVLGGSVGKDVWSSADLHNWVQVTSSANWRAAGNSIQAVVHRDRIYVLGGKDGSDYLSDVWSSTDGAHWSLVVSGDWPGRSNHQVVSHNDRIYVLGGTTANGLVNDVWSSADGQNWRRDTADIGWPPRGNYRAVSHKGRIYVVGGNNGGSYLKDVWSSADGKIWQRNTNTPQDQANHQLLSYNGLIYVLSGQPDAGGIWNRSHFSSNGLSWDWRYSLPVIHSDTVVFPPELALVGVGEGLTITTTVAVDNLHTFTAQYGVGDYTYSLVAVSGFSVSPEGVLSSDGASAGEYTLTVWVEDRRGKRAQTAVNVLVPYFSLADVPRLVGIKDSIPVLHTLIAQYGDAEQYQILSGNVNNSFHLSPDGVLSSKITAGIGLYTLAIEASDNISSETATTTITIEISGTRIYVLGGSTNNTNSGNKKDVWSSANGTVWVENLNTNWPARRGHQALVHNGLFYVLGGDSAGGLLNDVWSSANGKDWLQVTSTVVYTARWLHQAVSHNGSLYVAGGIDANGQTKDVWSSPDGEIWTLLTVNAGWDPRWTHQMVSHNGSLYVLGGLHWAGPQDEHNYPRKNDVWSSRDGKDWIQLVVTNPWPARDGHQAVSHNGSLYVLGGRTDGGLENDVWSSADGQSWDLVPGNTGWSERWLHQAVSRDGLLYVMGGQVNGGSQRNDVWSSSNGGVTWTRETENADWDKRERFQAIVFPDS